MKKIILMAAIALSITSCSTNNIETPKDNPSIPTVITQLAESKRELLLKDTLIDINLSEFEDQNFVYQYRITKQKVELEKKIKLEGSEGAAIIFGMVFALMIVLFIKLMVD